MTSNRAADVNAALTDIFRDDDARGAKLACLKLALARGASALRNVLETTDTLT
jgi:hypothetical protein